ncbi:hypothetical protein [Sulfitobacter sp. SK012]|nr:hypothetical protein [Sulfitobacter sp. SK012]
MTKTCTKCGESKPATLEYWSKHRGGLNPQCKVVWAVLTRNQPYTPHTA